MKLGHWLRAARNHWMKIREDAAVVPLWVAVALRVVHVYNRRRWRSLPPYSPILSFRVSGWAHPVHLRAQSNDLDVLRQVVGWREYAPLDDLQPRVVVDCGAYVGYSALYFLNRHPGATVVAVEPDPDNARCCAKNLAPYGSRARLVKAALWSHACVLALVRGEFRDGGSWSTQVRPASGTESADVQAVDVTTLLQAIGVTDVDILKIDVERSELAMFGVPSNAWLTHVQNIAIELHDEECERAFFAALDGFQFDLVRTGDLTICRGLTPKANRAAPNLGAPPAA